MVCTTTSLSVLLVGECVAWVVLVVIIGDRLAICVRFPYYSDVFPTPSAWFRKSNPVQAHGFRALADSWCSDEGAGCGYHMDLVKEGEKFAILTDILGDEDHLGDMDFKVAGTAKVFALRMTSRSEHHRDHGNRTGPSLEARLNILQMGCQIGQSRNGCRKP